MRKSVPVLLALSILLVVGFISVSRDEQRVGNSLDDDLQSIMKNSSLMGLQVQITQGSQPIYHGNFGLRDGVKPIQNATMFRAASLSKSVATAALMTLVDDGKLKLNDSISSILGFDVINPHFPRAVITVQMILSHQSSLVECDPYYSRFLAATYNAKTGFQVPHLRQILTPNGAFYNVCLWKNMAPGTHYEYVNLNFGIAGTLIQRLTNTRFDIFAHQRIMANISVGLEENATFNPFNITNPEHLGACFVGQGGKWVPQTDYYPDGKIPQRNLTGYVIGTNGVIFGPQGSMRASVSHLSNYMIMMAHGGVTKQNVRVLSTAIVKEMLKPRYQFHGKTFGGEIDFHTYGFGLYTTTYRTSDQIIPHQIVRGHTGSSYGLISAYYFWGDYTLTYIVNGALDGYVWQAGTIYEKVRVMICNAAYKYIRSLA